MHDIAPLAASTAVVFLGILAGILFNRRAIDKLGSRIESRMDRIESRLDRMQADMVEFFKMLSRHEEAVGHPQETQLAAADRKSARLFAE